MANQSDKKNMKNKKHLLPMFMAAIGAFTVIRLGYLLWSFFGEEFSIWDLFAFLTYLGINLYSYSNISTALELGISYS